MSGTQLPNLEIFSSQGKSRAVFDIEIADSQKEWEIGLMHREEMSDTHGMYFIFDEDEYRRFWMKNTLIPLDIIFINSELEIVDIAHDFQPCKSVQCEVITSSEVAKYVLEINGGLSEKIGIQIGDTVIQR